MVCRTRAVGRVKHSAPYRFIRTELPLIGLACALLFLLATCTQQSTATDTVTWVQITGAAKDIGAGGGKVWVVGVWPDAPFGDQIFRWTGGAEDTEANPWTPMPQGGTRITVDDRGHAWAIDALHNIYRFSRNSFQRIPGKAKDIGAGGGQVWIIGVDPQPPFGDKAYRWTGETMGNPWEPTDGAGSRIAVDDQGLPWVVNDQNDIFHFNGTAFEQVPGKARDIAVGGDKVWVIGVEVPPADDATGGQRPPRQEGNAVATEAAAGDKIYRWTGETTGNPWELMPGAGTQIAADRHGNPWLVNANHEVFKGTVAPAPGAAPGVGPADHADDDEDFIPKNGYVSDAATAIRIALAVWEPIFGKEQIADEKPYRARLTDGVWTVEGSMPEKETMAGGVALIEIAKDTGEILRVVHGQ